MVNSVIFQLNCSLFLFIKSGRGNEYNNFILNIMNRKDFVNYKYNNICCYNRFYHVLNIFTVFVKSLLNIAFVFCISAFVHIVDGMLLLSSCD